MTTDRRQRMIKLPIGHGRLNVTHDEDLEITSDPFVLFDSWYEAAQATEPSDPNAMSLATLSPDGFPAVRIVLMKGFTTEGVSFFTNSESNKGRDLAATPRAALCFHWKSLRRQVRISGSVSVLPIADADAYFATRSRHSQIGAWASNQSRPLANRQMLLARADEAAARFADMPVPRPPHWFGYRVRPEMIEFWQDRPFRLHDRLRFISVDDEWEVSRLAP